MMQLENILFNVMAHARSSTPFRLREDFKFRHYYFSQQPCGCGCKYAPPAPPVPVAPTHETARAQCADRRAA